MGIPVVIVAKGGVPVNPVDKRAPLLTESMNGMGLPITISDKGAPFIVDGWPVGADLYFDFIGGGRYFGGKPDVVRNGTASMKGLDDEYQFFGPNVPALIKGIGLQVLPQRANLLLNSAAPATQTISVVNGTVYTASVVGDGSITLSGAATGAATDGDPLTFTAAGTSLTVTVSGGPTYIQVEAGSFATPPIITTGSALTRPGDLVTAAVPDGGRAFVVKLKRMEPATGAGTRRILDWRNPANNHRQAVYIEAGGNLTVQTHNNVSGFTSSLPLALWGGGENMNVFGFAGDDFRRVGLASGPEAAPNTVMHPLAGLNTLGLGNQVVNTSANIAATFEHFTERRLRPGENPADLFAWAKATAEAML